MALAIISLLRSLVRELYLIAGYQECRKAFYLLAVTVSVLIANLIIVQETDSTALSAYSSLTIFDILFLLSALLSAWASRQETTLAYSYGYSRFEVLAVFTCTMLAQLNSFFIVKESVEHMFESDEDEHTHVHTASHGSTNHAAIKRQPLAVTVGAVSIAICHYACVYLVRHPAFDHVTRWCSSSWIQEQVAEISHSICRVLPFLSILLLPRVNPLSLIASVGLVMMMLTKLMIEVYDYHVADTGAAIMFAGLLIYTWLPMTKFTGRILLQSTPPHLLTQRDKIVNEIGTLDGVLEVKDDKLWSCGFNSLVITVKVRVRRDANEQMVLAHIHDKVSMLASEVTVQLVKDIDYSNAPAGRQFYWQHDAHMNDDHSGHGHSHSGGGGHSHDHGGHDHDHHAAPPPRYGGNNTAGGSDDFVVIDFDRNNNAAPPACQKQHSRSHEHSHDHRGAAHNHSHDHHYSPSTSYDALDNSARVVDNFYAGAIVPPYNPPSPAQPTIGFPIMPQGYSANIPAVDRSLMPPNVAGSLPPNSRRYVELSEGGAGVVSNRGSAGGSPSFGGVPVASGLAPPGYYGKHE